MSTRIAIVEDEAELAELSADYLRNAGHEVSIFNRGDTALAALRQHMPNLLVLDLMLPGMDGISLCRSVRQFSDVPIIMVTARSEEVDRLIGLEMGADDYLCKPFSPRELVARVRAILRRLGPAPLPDPEHKLYEIDEACQRILIKGTALELTPSEFRLLTTLIRRAGQVFSRAQLLDCANPEGLDVTDRAIDSHIKNLRKKLARFFPEAEVINSVYGVGYRLEWP
jgi:two-component system response regulator BaeR